MQALAACLAAFASAAQPDAADLLRRVAERYKTAETYTAEVRVTAEQGLPVRPYPGPNVSRVAAARGARYLLERGDLRIVSDGRTVWTSRRDLKQYTAEPLSSTAVGDEMFRGLERTLLKRFAWLDTAATDARVKGERDARTRSGSRRAYVLHLRPRSPEPETWTEELWIDAEHHTVLKSIWRDASPRFSFPLTRTTTFDIVDFTAPDAGLFTWTPPRGFRQVDRFAEATLSDGPGPPRLEKQGP